MNTKKSSKTSRNVDWSKEFFIVRIICIFMINRDINHNIRKDLRKLQGQLYTGPNYDIKNTV